MDYMASMQLVDLESEADRLLQAGGAIGRETGIYTSAGLKRKIRNEHRRAPLVSECGLPAEVVDRLVDQRIEELIDVSGLSIRQEIVFRLRVCGLGIKRIAATLNIKPQRAAALLRAAQRKVRRAYRAGAYAGWYEVYLSEVNRFKRH